MHFQALNLCRHNAGRVRPAAARCYAAQSAVSSSVAPKALPPLCKRPAQHEDSLGNLLAWQQAVEQRISDIGESFASSDGGPSEAELRTEVKWVLEDVVSDVRRGAGEPWEPCDWRQLSSDIRVAQQRRLHPERWQLRLRAPVEQLHAWWKQRLEDRVPYQYLVSTAHWRTYTLSVAPGVLIPRPETEIFADYVSGALARHPQLAGLPWADLGTGSGAIAMCAGEELGKALKKSGASGTQASPRVFAVDISAVAAAHARYNVQAAGLQQCVTVCEGSWFEPVCSHLTQTDTTPHHTNQQTATPRTHASSQEWGQGRTMQGDASPQRTRDTQTTQQHAAQRTTQPNAARHGIGSTHSQSQHEGEQQTAGSRDVGITAPGAGSVPRADSKNTGWRGPPRLGGVLSNPPYIPRAVMEAGLQAEVGRHEPWSALDGGPGEGMDSLSVVCEGAAAALVKDGFLALETAGGHQAHVVADYLRTLGAFRDIQVIKDCYGVERFVTAHRA